MAAGTDAVALTSTTPELIGPADTDAIAAPAEVINKTKRPLFLLALLASEPCAAVAVRTLLAKADAPVVCTYQCAGILPRELFHNFGGRVGLFHNQWRNRCN